MKIRFKTWYWGKFETMAAMPSGPDAADWELYDEDRHGWHQSEEAKAALSHQENSK